MANYSIIFAVLFIALLIFRFLIWAKSTKWYKLKNEYPLNSSNSKYENINLVYGSINMCGYYLWHTGFSGIIEDGVIIRKPFPFSLLMPPIFIPWSEVDSISIVTNIEGRSSTKIVKKISPLKYVKIKIKRFKEIIIIIPWRNRYYVSVPNDLQLKD